MKNYIHTTDVHNTTSAKVVLPYLFEKFKPKTVLDIGCGIGTWLKVAKDLGAKVKGMDGNVTDTNLFCISESEFKLQDLTKEVIHNEKYDLVICLEVVEHLPENAADTIIKTLTDASDIILFSAAIPYQGGQNHINEQWPIYWQNKFEKNKFFAVDLLRPIFWDNSDVEWWYRQNMLVYANEKMIEQYNLQISKPISVYIHPELFQLKLDEIKSKQNNTSSVSQNLKTLLKSILK